MAAQVDEEIVVYRYGRKMKYALTDIDEVAFQIGLRRGDLVRQLAQEILRRGQQFPVDLSARHYRKVADNIDVFRNHVVRNAIG